MGAHALGKAAIVGGIARGKRWPLGDRLLHRASMGNVGFRQQLLAELLAIRYHFSSAAAGAKSRLVAVEPGIADQLVSTSAVLCALVGRARRLDQTYAIHSPRSCLISFELDVHALSTTV